MGLKNSVHKRPSFSSSDISSSTIIEVPDLEGKIPPRGSGDKIDKLLDEETMIKNEARRSSRETYALLSHLPYRKNPCDYKRRIKIILGLTRATENFIYDYKIDCGTESYRPDFIYECDGYRVILEVDEVKYDEETPIVKTAKQIYKEFDIPRMIQIKRTIFLN